MIAGGPVPDEPGGRPATPRRRRRWIIALVGLAAVGAIVTFLVLWNRVTVQPVSMDTARRRAGLDTDSSTPAAPLVPAAGVYRYRGEGTEELDTPPKSQPQGPDIPGTVTHLDDRCWRLRVDYNTNHWQSWDYCSTGTGLTETAGAFFQRLDLGPFTVDTSSSYTCDPPVDTIRATQEPGDQWRQACRGTSTASDGEVLSAGPYTFIGQERLDIGGRSVAALRYHRARTLSGGQNGTEDVSTWFDVTTGLPLQNSRAITVHSDSRTRHRDLHRAGEVHPHLDDTDRLIAGCRRRWGSPPNLPTNRHSGTRPGGSTVGPTWCAVSVTLVLDVDGVVGPRDPRQQAFDKVAQVEVTREGRRVERCTCRRVRRRYRCGRDRRRRRGRARGVDRRPVAPRPPGACCRATT